ncbi:MAG: DUF481 domain-containing protein [Sandaracinaceae bacterium]
MHAPRTHTLVFDDRTSLKGPAMLTERWVVVQTEGGGIVVRARQGLAAVIEGGVKELDAWSTMLSAGMALNRGNSNQIGFNLRWTLRREDRRTLTWLDYRLNLGWADREQNVNQHVIHAEERVWLTQGLFLSIPAGQLLSDRFQDIRFRAQPAAALGVRIRDHGIGWLQLSVGPGYQYLLIEDPAADLQNPQHDGIVRFVVAGRLDVTAELYVELSWVTNLTYTDLGNTNHTGIAGVFFEITNVLGLEASMLYLRTEEPPRRADGERLSPDDVQVTLRLALDLG